MGVKIITKSEGAILLKVGAFIGLTATTKAMDAEGVTMELKPKVLTIENSLGNTLAQQSFNSETVVLMLDKKLASYSEKIMIEKLRDLVIEAWNASNLSSNDEIDAEVSGYVPDVTKDDDEPAVPAKPAKKPAAKKNLSSALSDIDTGESKDSTGLPITGAKVKLVNATKLHQPVNGSSSGSTYHCVALGDVLAAARMKAASDNWDVSVRFEGAVNTKQAMAAFNECKVKHHGDYASIHLSGTGGVALAKRAVGALLIGSGLPFSAVSTQLQSIVNKGN